jgi:hypothetical protein
VAGRLWWQILEQASNIDYPKSDEFEGFYLYSAHYETLLGLFAALSQDPPGGTSHAIPNYASAVIVEVYSDDSKKDTVLKVFYKEGGSDEKETVKVKKCGSSDSCKLGVLTGLFKALTWEKWCKECGNIDANVCISAQAKPSTDVSASASANGTEYSTTSASTSTGTIVGSVLLGMVIALILMGMFACYRRRRFSKEMNAGAMAGNLQMNPTESSDDEGSDENFTNSVKSVGSEKIKAKPGSSVYPALV